MDRDAILARMADLEAQRQAALDQLNAIMGAIQDCEYWLRLEEQLRTEPPADEPKE